MVPVAELEKTLKERAKLPLVLSKMSKLGFHFEGRIFSQEAKTFRVSYPDNPYLIPALKGLAMVTPYENADAHRCQEQKDAIMDPQFLILRYRLVADPDTLPAEHRFDNFLLMLEEPNRAFAKEFHRRVMELGFLYRDSQLPDDSVDYYYNGSLAVRLMYDVITDVFTCRLRLYDVNRYTNEIAEMAPAVKENFTCSSCGHCSFQHRKEDACPHRMIWTLEGNRYEGCEFGTFYCGQPALKDIEDYLRLLKLEHHIGE